MLRAEIFWNTQSSWGVDNRGDKAVIEVLLGLDGSATVHGVLAGVCVCVGERGASKVDPGVSSSDLGQSIHNTLLRGASNSAQVDLIFSRGLYSKARDSEISPKVGARPRRILKADLATCLS